MVEMGDSISCSYDGMNNPWGPPTDPWGIPGDGGSSNPSQGEDIGSKNARTDKDCGEGNPILPSTGNKVEPEVDFLSSGERGLWLQRTYNHYWQGVGLFGKHWVSTLDYKLSFGTTNVDACYPRPGGGACGIGSNTVIYAWRPDGRTIKFMKAADGIFYEDKPQAVAKIVQQGDGKFILYSESFDAETYSSAGYIISVISEQGIGWTYTYSGGTYPLRVTHTSGRYLEFTWTSGQLTAVRDPGGNYYGYAYHANQFGTGLHRLASSSQPGAPATTITYHYELGTDNSALTGKSYNSVRYSTFAYNANGYAISSEHNGQDKYTFSYVPGSNGLLTTTVTNPLGKRTVYKYQDGNLTEVNGEPSTYCPAATMSAITYDVNGYPEVKSDNNGNDTVFQHNAKGQVLSKIEAYGTALARTTQYVWDAVRNRLTGTTVVGVATTTYTYNADNRLSSVVATNLLAPSPANNLNQTRATTYSYTKHANGMLASMTVDGPLPGAGDAITRSFDNQGNLVSISNSLNHTVTYSSFNGLGRPGRVTGINGDITDYTYDQRGRITRVRTYPNGSTAADTTYSYDNKSRLWQVTGPDGLTQTFGYHASNADWLSSVSAPTTLSDPSAQDATDSIGLHRDAMGNVTRRSHYKNELLPHSEPCVPPPGYEYCVIGPDDPPTISYQWFDSETYRTYADYDELGRQRAKRGNAGQNLRYGYDPNGNVQTVTDSAGKVTTRYYDALDRVIQSTNPLSGSTYFEYDAADRVTKVTDPRGKITTFSYDGFGQLWKQVSPDTGTTTHVYDAYGRKTQMVRNDGSSTTYAFDNLGRLTGMASGSDAIGYAYDSCTNGKGRLCTATSPNNATHFQYEPDGRLRQQNQQTTGNGTQTSQITYYFYDAVGRLNSMTYPSGIGVGYGYSLGKLRAMTVNIGGTVTDVVVGAQYQPFGPAVGWSYGNGLLRAYGRDLDGRLTAASTRDGGTNLQELAYGYDTKNRITGITNASNSSLTQSYGYDFLSRLTSVTSGSGNQSFSYDPNGNKTQHVWTGTETLSVDPASNRISAMGSHSYSYDNRGNRSSQIIGGSTATYSYDGFNRMASASRNIAASYAEPNYVTVNLPAGTNVYGYNAFNERTWKAAPSHGSYRYVYGPGSVLLGERRETDGQWTNYLWFNGELVGMVRGSTRYFVHTDQLGRPEIVTNTGKAVVWRASNFAYDRKVTQDSIGGLNIGFPGQYHDQETNLWYNINRYYDARLGAYTQSDPIGLAGGLNTYAYVSGNPVMGVDFFGLAQNSSGGVYGWLCDAINSGSDPEGYLRDARNNGLDKGDSNLVAAERYVEMYNGNYEGHPPMSQDTFNLGQHILKQIRTVPGMSRVFGENGSPASDSEFIARWGALGVFHRREGVALGGPKDPCTRKCEK